MKRGRLSRNVIVLGALSLLTDASSEMIIPLLPVFLTATLGASALALGWLEGLAEATARVLKLLSGRWSDRQGCRRPFVLGGDALSALARPLVALAAAPWHVLAVRLADRTGKGLCSDRRNL
ncbi:MAG: MFS transporter [Myxococcales bacterium]|nr:MFS transporter [Myxococcales bacterium]